MSELSTRNEEMSAVVDGREKAAVHNRVANFQTLVWDLRLFVILQTFLILFYICLKPRLFGTFHHKTTSKHPRIQEFCKKNLWFQTKTSKALPPSWLLLCLGKPMTCGNAYFKHFAKSSDFFETQCWQPWCIIRLQV